MKILHVTPHLGGGVGKAHAAISAVLPEIVEQIFVLLEPPRDRRFVDRIQAAGAEIVVAESLDHVASLAHTVDIVQFEFWNHPRMLECLARAEFPAMRSIFWSHISGLFNPRIPPGLMTEAGRFVFTTSASLSIPSVSNLHTAERKKITVINSGFGFADARPRVARGRKPGVAYLGTVDFLKMHPGFFDAVDAVVDDDLRVSVWGEVDPAGAVAARARAMRHPDRVRFMGHASDAAEALAQADIFFYPLQREHYGTAENALIEAMSLGSTALVLNNPAEMAIIRDAETGFIAASVEELASLLQNLLLLPEVREKISANAVRHIAKTRTPVISAQDFMIQWLGLLAEAPRCNNFTSAIGETPVDWYFSTQGSREMPSARHLAETPSKGTLAHFESVFAGDKSFSRLRNRSA